MIYFLIFILFFALEIIYFQIAIKYQILDIPNDRSSHTCATIRGGGIILWIAALLYFLLNLSYADLVFFLGISLAAGISFWDDVCCLGYRVRLFFQVLALSFAFYFTGLFFIIPWWGIVIGYVFFMGVLNAFNFMDGINGMSGLYMATVLISLLYINHNIYPFTDPNFIIYPLLASVVFLFFNFRKKAKCFAGDVGSIAAGFWVITLLILLMIETKNLVWIGLLMVYGVDSVLTILHRVLLKQNLTKPHRLHFFQILANEQGIDHRVISITYSVTQFFVSLLIIELYPIMGWWIMVITGFILSLVYCLKFRFIKQNQKLKVESA
jgi:UDP-N-acetylmuramyl pentapeptide phosphotransferase/UDP-N-acetylglucosamine-1-phosphate transferase